MTHELKRILEAYSQAQKAGTPCVLATVVHLQGSSYRRPGVRMLLLENGEMEGAVSGGCVEKEVMRQAMSVFTNGIAKMMTYDGRYRLGCEGILHILLEPFELDTLVVDAITETIKQRGEIEIISYFEKKETSNSGFGSVVRLNDALYGLQKGFVPFPNAQLFRQQLKPCQRLVVIGAEHDAVSLVKIAAAMGWEVLVVADEKEERTLDNFPGAQALFSQDTKLLDLHLDAETAIIVMTHSYAKDFLYLSALKDAELAYIGLLGPVRRREKLFHELIEKIADISPEFLDRIQGPAGLDIGAETPEEIAIAIIAEILAVTRNKTPAPLKNKKGNIH